MNDIIYLNGARKTEMKTQFLTNFEWVLRNRPEWAREAVDMYEKAVYDLRKKKQEKDRESRDWK